MKKNAPATNGNESAQTRRHCTRQDLFPDTLPPASVPRWPTTGTIKEKALLALIFGPLTQPEFSWSWRLAAYIRDLADDGFEILTRDVAYAGTVIAEYRLDRSDPATAAALDMRQGGPAW